MPQEVIYVDHYPIGRSAARSSPRKPPAKPSSTFSDQRPRFKDARVPYNDDLVLNPKPIPGQSAGLSEHVFRSRAARIGSVESPGFIQDWPETFSPLGENWGKRGHSFGASPRRSWGPEFPERTILGVPPDPEGPVAGSYPAADEQHTMAARTRRTKHSAPEFRSKSPKWWQGQTHDPDTSRRLGKAKAAVQAKGGAGAGEERGAVAGGAGGAGAGGAGSLEGDFEQAVKRTFGAVQLPPHLLDRLRPALVPGQAPEPREPGEPWPAEYAQMGIMPVGVLPAHPLPGFRRRRRYKTRVPPPERLPVAPDYFAPEMKVREPERPSAPFASTAPKESGLFTPRRPLLDPYQDPSADRKHWTRGGYPVSSLPRATSGPEFPEPSIVGAPRVHVPLLTAGGGPLPGRRYGSAAAHEALAESVLRTAAAAAHPSGALTART
eukprot:tig00000802_g4314.t1